MLGFLMAFVFLLLGTGACGSSHQSGSPSPRNASLGKAFQSKATAVCKLALSQKKAQGQFPYPDFNPTQPDLSKLPSIARLEAKTVMIYQAWLHKMVALGQPNKGRTAWTNVLRDLRGNLRTIADQRAAGERKDGKVFTNDYYVGNRFQHDLEQASDAVGLPVCAAAAAA
jgi:hypothetical protein